jgi:hypothetical protein
VELDTPRPISDRGRASANPSHRATIKADFQLVGLSVRHSLGLVVEGGDDLVGVLFRVVKSQAADREIDDFMTVPRSRPG